MTQSYRSPLDWVNTLDTQDDEEEEDEIRSPLDWVNSMSESGDKTVASPSPAINYRFDLDSLMGSMRTQESGDDPFVTPNKRTQAGGLYQIMPNNIGPWSKEALGRTVTREQYLNDPELQEKIARFKLKQYWDEEIEAGYDDIETARRVAARWYSGPENGDRHTDDTPLPFPGEPSRAGYVDQIMDRIRKEQANPKPFTTEGMQLDGSMASPRVSYAQPSGMGGELENVKEVKLDTSGVLEQFVPGTSPPKISNLMPLMRVPKEPTERDFTGNVSESWRRAEIGMHLDQIAHQIAVGNTDYKIPALLAARKQLRELNAKDPIKNDNFFAGMVTGATGLLPAMKAGMTTGASTATAAIVAGAALPIPEEIVSVPAAFTAGSTTYWAKQGQGAMFASFLEEGIDPDVAAFVASSASIPYAMLEAMQWEKVAGKLFPGVKNKLYEAALAKAKDLMLKKGKKTVGREIAKRAIEYPIAVLSNVGEEVGQQGVESLAKIFAKDLHKGLTGEDIDSQRAAKLRDRVSLLTDQEREQMGYSGMTADQIVEDIQAKEGLLAELVETLKESFQPIMGVLLVPGVGGALASGANVAMQNRSERQKIEAMTEDRRRTEMAAFEHARKVRTYHQSIAKAYGELGAPQPIPTQNLGTPYEKREDVQRDTEEAGLEKLSPYEAGEARVVDTETALRNLDNEDAVDKMNRGQAEYEFALVDIVNDWESDDQRKAALDRIKNKFGRVAVMERRMAERGEANRVEREDAATAKELRAVEGLEVSDDTIADLTVEQRQLILATNKLYEEGSMDVFGGVDALQKQGVYYDVGRNRVTIGPPDPEGRPAVEEGVSPIPVQGAFTRPSAPTDTPADTPAATTDRPTVQGATYVPGEVDAEGEVIQGVTYNTASPQYRATLEAAIQYYDQKEGWTSPEEREKAVALLGAYKTRANLSDGTEKGPGQPRLRDPNRYEEGLGFPAADPGGRPVVDIRGKRIELSFPDGARGPEETVAQLESQKFRFSSAKGSWYATATPARETMAKRLAAGPAPLKGQGAQVPTQGATYQVPTASPEARANIQENVIRQNRISNPLPDVSAAVITQESGELPGYLIGRIRTATPETLQDVQDDIDIWESDGDITPRQGSRLTALLQKQVTAVEAGEAVPVSDKPRALPGDQGGRQTLYTMAGQTGPRNRETMKERGYAALFTPAQSMEAINPDEGQPWAYDNGAYSAWAKKGKDGTSHKSRSEPLPREGFDLDAWEAKIREVATHGQIDNMYMAVLPDLPMGGNDSFSLSKEALERVRDLGLPFYLPVQNGMDQRAVEDFLYANPEVAGIFLGGDDGRGPDGKIDPSLPNFKGTEGPAYAQIAHNLGRKFHYARAGSRTKINEALGQLADSMDSTLPNIRPKALKTLLRRAPENIQPELEQLSDEEYTRLAEWTQDYWDSTTPRQVGYDFDKGEVDGELSKIDFLLEDKGLLRGAAEVSADHHPLAKVPHPGLREAPPVKDDTEEAPAVTTTTPRPERERRRPQKGKATTDGTQQEAAPVEGQVEDGASPDPAERPERGDGTDRQRRLRRRILGDPQSRIVTARPGSTAEVDASFLGEGTLQHLSPHQQQGAAKAIMAMDTGSGGFLLADGTGVGKTRQLLTVAKHYAEQGNSVLIIAPNEVLGKPFEKGKDAISGSYAADGATLGIELKLTKEEDALDGGTIYVSTYYHGYMASLEKAMGDNTVIIWDESHALKNISKGTGTAVRGRRMSSKAAKVMFSTATPADQFTHMEYMERAGLLEGKEPKQAYEDLGLVLRGDGWVVNSNVGEKEVMERVEALFDRLTQAGRMVKREISFAGVDVDFDRIELPSEGWKALNDIEEGFNAHFPNGVPGIYKALLATHLRLQQEPYKVQRAVEMATEALEEGRQVIIFAVRVNESDAGLNIYQRNEQGERVLVGRDVFAESEGTAKLLRKAFEDRGITDIAELHGEANESSQTAQDRFQSGAARVMIATIGSGGTGINLDDRTGEAPRTVIMMTAPYSAIDNVQAAGRAWRLTTQSIPHIRYIYTGHHIDMSNMLIISGKMAQLGAQVQGEFAKLQEGGEASYEEEVVGEEDVDVEVGNTVEEEVVEETPVEEEIVIDVEPEDVETAGSKTRARLNKLLNDGRRKLVRATLDGDEATAAQAQAEIDRIETSRGLLPPAEEQEAPPAPAAVDEDAMSIDDLVQVGVDLSLRLQLAENEGTGDAQELEGLARMAAKTVLDEVGLENFDEILAQVYEVEHTTRESDPRTSMAHGRFRGYLLGARTAQHHADKPAHSGKPKKHPSGKWVFPIEEYRPHTDANTTILVYPPDALKDMQYDTKKAAIEAFRVSQSGEATETPVATVEEAQKLDWRPNDAWQAEGNDMVAEYLGVQFRAIVEKSGQAFILVGDKRGDVSFKDYYPSIDAAMADAELYADQAVAIFNSLDDLAITHGTFRLDPKQMADPVAMSLINVPPVEEAPTAEDKIASWRNNYRGSTTITLKDGTIYTGHLFNIQENKKSRTFYLDVNHESYKINSADMADISRSTEDAKRGIVTPTEEAPVDNAADIQAAIARVETQIVEVSERLRPIQARIAKGYADGYTVGIGGSMEFNEDVAEEKEIRESVMFPLQAHLRVLLNVKPGDAVPADMPTPALPRDVRMEEVRQSNIIAGVKYDLSFHHELGPGLDRNVGQKDRDETRANIEKITDLDLREKLHVRMDATLDMGKPGNRVEFVRRLGLEVGGEAHIMVDKTNYAGEVVGQSAVYGTLRRSPSSNFRIERPFDQNPYEVPLERLGDLRPGHGNEVASPDFSEETEDAFAGMERVLPQGALPGGQTGKGLEGTAFGGVIEDQAREDAIERDGAQGDMFGEAPAFVETSAMWSDIAIADESTGVLHDYLADLEKEAGLARGDYTNSPNVRPIDVLEARIAEVQAEIDRRNTPTMDLERKPGENPREYLERKKAAIEARLAVLDDLLENANTNDDLTDAQYEDAAIEQENLNDALYDIDEDLGALEEALTAEIEERQEREAKKETHRSMLDLGRGRLSADEVERIKSRTGTPDTPSVRMSLGHLVNKKGNGSTIEELLEDLYGDPASEFALRSAGVAVDDVDAFAEAMVADPHRLYPASDDALASDLEAERAEQVEGDTSFDFGENAKEDAPAESVAQPRRVWYLSDEQVTMLDLRRDTLRLMAAFAENLDGNDDKIFTLDKKWEIEEAWRLFDKGPDLIVPIDKLDDNMTTDPDGVRFQLTQAGLDFMPAIAEAHAQLAVGVPVQNMPKAGYEGLHQGSTWMQDGDYLGRVSGGLIIKRALPKGENAKPGDLKARIDQTVDLVKMASVTPVVFQQAESMGHTSRWVWFDDGAGIDGSEYHHVMKLYPKAQWRRLPAENAPYVALDGKTPVAIIHPRGVTPSTAVREHIDQHLQHQIDSEQQVPAELRGRPSRSDIRYSEEGGDYNHDLFSQDLAEWINSIEEAPEHAEHILRPPPNTGVTPADNAVIIGLAKKHEKAVKEARTAISYAKRKENRERGFVPRERDVALVEEAENYKGLYNTLAALAKIDPDFKRNPTLIVTATSLNNSSIDLIWRGKNKNGQVREHQVNLRLTTPDPKGIVSLIPGQTVRLSQDLLEKKGMAPGKAGDYPAGSLTPLHGDAQRETMRRGATSTTPMPMTMPTLGQQAAATNGPAMLDALARVVQEAANEAQKPMTVPIRQGLMGPDRGTMGTYRPFEEMISIRVANDIGTAAHEVGHALEKVLYGWDAGGPWVPQVSGIDQASIDELLREGKIIYPGKNPPTGGWKREGFAQYLYFRLAEDDIATRMPAFHAFFEDEIIAHRPQLAKALDQARDEIMKWRAAGAVARARAHLIPVSTRSQQVREGIATVRRDWKYEMVDMAHPFERLVDAIDMNRYVEAQVLAGVPRDKALHALPASQDPYKLFKALRMTAGRKVRYMVEDKMIDMFGRKTGGGGLNEITPLVEGRRKDFTIYLWAKRAQALWTDPEGARNPGMSAEEADHIAQELYSPQFEKAAQLVYKWERGILDIIASSSPFMADMVARIDERDPGNYVSLQREFTALDKRFAGYSGNNPVKHLRGSGRRVLDPFQTMIRNAEALVSAAMKRRVLEAAVNLANIEGMGHMIRRVPADLEKKYTAQANELVKKLGSLGFEINPSEQSIESMGLDPSDPADVDLAESLMGQELLNFFGPAAGPRPGSDKPVVPIKTVDALGNPVSLWYEVDEQLYKALEGIDVFQFNSKITDLVFATPARLARAGHTSLRAGFAVRNTIKDLFTFLINTRSASNSLYNFSMWGSTLAQAALHSMPGVDYETSLTDAFARTGVDMSMPLGQDIGQTDRAIRRLFGKKIITLDPRHWGDSMMNLWDGYREMIQFSEAAPRMAEMEMRRKRAEIGLRAKKNDPNLIVDWDGLGLDDLIETTIFGKEVTTDFTASGRTARWLNQIVPFMNAGIQGKRATIRRLIESPFTTILRMISTITVPTIALFAMNRDEPWYKEIPWRERFLYWHVPMGDDTLVRIPRPHDLGLLAGALPEALLARLDGQSPHIVDEFLKAALEVGMIEYKPQLLRLLEAGYSEMDEFWDRRIVPKYLHGKPTDILPDPEEYNEYTSRLSIELGAAINKSPMRIDHILRQSGGFYYDAARLIGGVGKDGSFGKSLGEALSGGEGLEDIPIFGTLFARGGQQKQYRLRSVDELYDKYEQLQAINASVANPATWDQKRQLAIAENATLAVSTLRSLRRDVADKAKISITQRIAQIARDANTKLANPAELDQNQEMYMARQLAEVEESLAKEAQGEPIDQAERRGQVARMYGRLQMAQRLQRTEEIAQARQAILRLTEHAGGYEKWFNRLSDKHKAAYRGQRTAARKNFAEKFREVGSVYQKWYGASAQ